MFPQVHERILPSCVSQHRLYFDRPLPPDVSLITLPASLERAVPRRQLHFRAGRYCATKAMLRLDPSLAGRDVGRRADGVPLWPEGVVGSITHTEGVAAAAVASTRHVMALGIDTERIMSESQAREVSRLVAWPVELVHGRSAGMTRLEALTLVFSAKESIFKCLSRIVGRRFDFHDVRIVHVVPGTFTARVVCTLSDSFRVNTTLHGRFACESFWIHTGVVLTADS
jgi:enterobactin synthetase component D